MTRQTAVRAAAQYFDDGGFTRDLARKVAQRTASEEEGSLPVLQAYQRDETAPELEAMGFTTRVLDNPVAGCGPYVIAERIEDAAQPTVLLYAHGDVIRGQDAQWAEGRSPWELAEHAGRLYGRGTADNKGQWTVNLGALRATQQARGGRLGFNTRVIVEMAEERGSPGLNDFCRRHADLLAADLFLASDGPRLGAATPTLFLGSRGILNFALSLRLREGAHHSGNWGGLLRNPGTVLASAIASLVSADGAILTPLLRPTAIPESVRRSLAALQVGGAPDDPEVDAGWGEPGLTPAERVFAWNTLEVLGLECGSVARPIGAIPAVARAVCQLRYVVGTDLDGIEARLQAHFDALGMPWVRVALQAHMAATRLDPEHPAVAWAARSVEATTGRAPAILPNLGGTIPNDVFAQDLGLPTVWVPHSYPACSQHAPNEHLLASAAREGLQIMAGLFWDLGEPGAFGWRSAQAQ
ncbi:M20 family metallopeptidase [Pseudorhodoferax sp. Leaf267]|uniref:M20 family metallopeptidase n=1 Tax=Pseudorhodoferax sp. Leaf267 TaxID=1736316 RepID=UPI0006FF8205|nr:M20 family metallopeptidase [Pseudorhodoferax sp. Leaf267]KQP14096.1 hypothetical protein ASF43_14745 [Pseudorhodoferax sp. Leaf267]